MAITTDTGKLAVMALATTIAPNLPLSPGTLGQDDQQQLLWGFPETLWTGIAIAAILQDLTTVFVPYVDTLVDLALDAVPDACTEISEDLAAVRASNAEEDLNTLYAIHLS